jgi:uncharacterized BrkB/YihY/UPF0761 family membrane protein
LALALFMAWGAFRLLPDERPWFWRALPGILLFLISLYVGWIGIEILLSPERYFD